MTELEDVMKSMMIAPGDTVRIVGPTTFGDVELLGKIGKISKETPMGRYPEFVEEIMEEVYGNQEDE